jgi:tousled-like kinase
MLIQVLTICPSLFDDQGDVKITDFGLSKIVEDTVIGTSIDLTSQGSGTYWYLPPECSERDPVISPKVDIWSVGVIFYQMLFGKRPYGEGKSQDQVLKEGIMVRLITPLVFHTYFNCVSIAESAAGCIPFSK